MTRPFILYGRPGLGQLAPQILLEELGLQYEVRWVDDSPTYRTLNPTGKIPALTLPDGTSIFESAAICIHLTNISQSGELAPPLGTEAHARYLQWMIFLSANLYDSIVRCYHPARFSTDGDRIAEGVREQALADFDRHAELIENTLSPFILGEHICAADFYLFMISGWYPPDPSLVYAKFPKLGKLVAAVSSRPAVITVMQAQTAGADQIIH